MVQRASQRGERARRSRPASRILWASWDHSSEVGRMCNQARSLQSPRGHRLQPLELPDDMRHAHVGAGWRGRIRNSGQDPRNRMFVAGRLERNAVSEGLKYWHASCLFITRNCLDIDNLFGSEFGAVRTARERRLGGELLTSYSLCFHLRSEENKKEAFE